MGMFRARLVNSLGLTIGHIRCDTNLEGTRSIRDNWLPLLDEGDHIVIDEVGMPDEEAIASLDINPDVWVDFPT